MNKYGMAANPHIDHMWLEGLVGHHLSIWRAWWWYKYKMYIKRRKKMYIMLRTSCGIQNFAFHRYVKKDARVSLAGTDLVIANITQEVIVNCNDHCKHHNILIYWYINITSEDPWKERWQRSKCTLDVNIVKMIQRVPIKIEIWMMMRKMLKITFTQWTLICELSPALFPPYPDDASYQWNGWQWGSSHTQQCFTIFIHTACCVHF